MNLLLFEWNGLMQKDLEEVLHALHISFYRFSYHFSNIHEDEFFCTRFNNHLKAHHYDAVFSFNYFPLVAKVCFEHNLKYLSWCYDSPVRIIPYDTFALPTNYIFMFDRKEALEYQEKGLDTVFHMPLAVNQKRITAQCRSLQGTAPICDISFLGNFHKSNFLDFLEPLPNYEQGYLKALVKAQQKLRTYYLPDDFFQDELMNTLNGYYKKYTNDSSYTISKEDLSFLFGKYVTETDRIAYLRVLSEYFHVNLYANSCPAKLPHVHFMGTARYYTEMSRIFALSKINFNLSFYCIRTGISLRILDILAAGGFLLTNYQEELAEYYDLEQDLVVYTDIPDAVEKADFYLKHDDLRQKQARSGQARTFEHFSYEKQLSKIFNIAKLEL